MTGIFCSLCACRIDDVTVRIAMKKTPIASIERYGAFSLTDDAVLSFPNKRYIIGYARVASPKVHGIATPDARRIDEDIVDFARSSLFDEIEEAHVGVRAAEIGKINAGGSLYSLMLIYHIPTRIWSS